MFGLNNLNILHDYKEIKIKKILVISNYLINISGFRWRKDKYLGKKNIKIFHNI